MSEPLLLSETISFILPTITSCEWEHATLLAGRFLSQMFVLLLREVLSI